MRGKKNKKGFLTLRSFGNNGRGLFTTIRAELPANITSTSMFHEKDLESDEAQDLESQQGITKTTHVETSISSRADIQETEVSHF